MKAPLPFAPPPPPLKHNPVLTRGGGFFVFCFSNKVSFLLYNLNKWVWFQCVEMGGVRLLLGITFISDLHQHIHRDTGAEAIE